MKRPFCDWVHTVRTGNNASPNIHDRIVLAAYSIGIGFQQCKEFLSIIGVPNLTSYLYGKATTRVNDEIKKTTQLSFQDAMKAEVQICKDRGETRDSDGFFRILSCNY